MVNCVLLWARPGMEAALSSYEDKVLRLVAEHGGRVLERGTVLSGSQFGPAVSWAGPRVVTATSSALATATAPATASSRISRAEPVSRGCPVLATGTTPEPGQADRARHLAAGSHARAAAVPGSAPG